MLDLAEVEELKGRGRQHRHAEEREISEFRTPALPKRAMGAVFCRARRRFSSRSEAVACRPRPAVHGILPRHRDALFGPGDGVDARISGVAPSTGRPASRQAALGIDDRTHAPRLVLSCRARASGTADGNE